MTSFSVNLPLSFLAGILAAFNPCGIVLLPYYITYIFTQKHNNNDNNILLIAKGFKIGLSMTGGFISIFLLTGTLVSIFGYFVMRAAPWISVIIGFILALTGIILLFKSEKFYLNNFFSSIGHKIQQKNSFNFFLYGIGYALVSLGCSLPIFMMVVFTNFNTGDLQAGLFGFILFSLGMGLVVTIISILSLITRKTVEKKIKKILPYMQKISGVLIFLTGIYLIYYWLLGPGSM